MLKGKAFSRRNVTCREVEGRGRSAFANKTFHPGQFVCEYASIVRRTTATDWGEERNAELGIGCYCLDATYQGVQYTFDAGPRINDPGRYINHAAKNANLVKMKPVMIGTPPNQRLRIGFVAKKTINEGDELFFDYGIRDQEIPWLQDDAKSIATTLDSLVKPLAKHTRPLQDCPVSGCQAVCLSKLADHLRCTHKFDKKTRRIYLNIAKKVKIHTTSHSIYTYYFNQPGTKGKAQGSH